MLYRKSLDLIDILLQLADEGFQAHVLDLFKFPVQYCPDLLLLGLLQTVRQYRYLLHDSGGLVVTYMTAVCEILGHSSLVV